MDVIIDETLKSPIATKIILIALITVLIFGLRTLYKIMLKNFKTLMNEIKLINYKIDATDYALAHSLKNGYQDARDRMFNELKANDEFVKRNSG